MQITHLSWGRLDADGQTFKDARLGPNGASEWDWSETGTRHQPGIQRADVEDLVEQGVDVVVLSQGVHERLGVHHETIPYLESVGVEVVVLQTEAAAERYNELVKEGRRVGGLFHTTC